MEKSRVLIVEDDPDTLELVRFILTRAGFDVLLASNGLEGLKAARESHPSLILLDMAMPEMDGIATTKELKADPKTQDIPIVALTVRALSSDRKKALDAGCVGYITKPMDVAAFVTEVKKWTSV